MRFALIVTDVSSLDSIPGTLFGQDAFGTRAWYGSTMAACLPRGATPCFQVASDGQDVLAVLPMMRHARCLSALATPYTCLWRPLVAQGVNADRLAEIGLALAPAWRRATVVRLEALSSDDPAIDALLAGLRRAGLRALGFDHFGNWHLDVSGLGWDAYLAGRPGELRSTIRRCTRRLLQAAGATFSLVQGADGLEAAIAAYSFVYGASWKDPEPYPDFNPTLMRACAANGSLRLGTIMLAGVPIATQFWLVHGHWAGVLKLAHDEAHRALAPGTVLTALMIRHLLDVDGVRELDFGRGDDAYKRLWTGERRQRVGVLVVDPLSRKGMIEIARHEFGRLRKSLARPAPTRAGQSDVS